MKVIEPHTTEQPDTSIDARMYKTHSDFIAVIKSMVGRNIQSEISYGSTITDDCDDGVVNLRGYFSINAGKNSALCIAIRNPYAGKEVDEASL